MQLVGRPIGDEEHGERQAEPNPDGEVRQEGEELEADLVRVAAGCVRHPFGLRRCCLLCINHRDPELYVKSDSTYANFWTFCTGN